ncbi:GDP-L-galactose phosphorylase 1-like protein [Cinnamomum micranthum f. kanehirae]|uniref:GDP-L-galactose phosphorylase 1-like protein n=1 Tax=Cinnamomum micranthum f. kanehirae TaxID=337451 RepID=A0A443P4X2_9MAGN|nr:GDP-L-galactose phosphorylase 1-like protein [Cinnamomum micranthum f. kanehirae]
MVSVKQFDDDYCLLKQNSGSELSKCSGVPWRGIGNGIPLYCLGTQPVRGNDAYRASSCHAEEEQSLLDSLLLAQWEDRAWKGPLKYDVTNCEMKFISGSRKLIAQLNEEWNSNYFPELAEYNVLRSFDHFKFNCMKTFREELLFCVARGEKAKSELITSTILPNDANLVILNANPVEYGHVFIVPINFYNPPQFLDLRSLELAAQFAIDINNCSFRVFYDYHASLRVNSSYFQACYFANPLPVELVPVVPVIGNWQERGIHIFEVSDYPVKTLMFKGKDNFKMLVALVSEICSSLQDQQIPFNLLISECSTKIFLFPQVRASSADACNLSAWECGGHFVFRARQDFDLASEESLVKRLAAISLDSEGFQAVKQMSCSIASELSS